MDENSITILGVVFGLDSVTDMSFNWKWVSQDYPKGNIALRRRLLNSPPLVIKIYNEIKRLEDNFKEQLLARLKSDEVLFGFIDQNGSISYYYRDNLMKIKLDGWQNAYEGLMALHGQFTYYKEPINVPGKIRFMGTQELAHVIAEIHKSDTIKFSKSNEIIKLIFERIDGIVDELLNSKITQLTSQLAKLVD